MAAAAALAVQHMAVLWRGAAAGRGMLHDGEHQEFPAAEEHTKYQSARASGGEQGAGEGARSGAGGRGGCRAPANQCGQGAAGQWGEPGALGLLLSLCLYFFAGS